jgi:hypothetical protein
MTDPTEDLFSGLDRPRPLPAELRQRLEEQLLAAAETPTEVPLGPDLDERLRAQLIDPVAAALVGIDGARPLDPALRQRLESQLLRRRQRARAFLGAAAVVVLGLGVAALILLPATAHRHPTSRAAGPVAPSAVGGGAGLGGGPQSGPGGVIAGPNVTTKGFRGVPGPAAAGQPGTLFGESADTAATAQRVAAPLVGPLHGGTAVTVRDAGLESAVAVVFGSAEASFQVLSDTSIRAVAPAAAHAGTVDVVVRLSSGATYRYPAAFRYVETASGPRHPTAA